MEANLINTIKTQRLELKLLKFNLSLAREIHQSIMESLPQLKPFLEWANQEISLENTIRHLIETESEQSLKNTLVYGLFLNSKYVGRVKIALKKQDKMVKIYEIGYWLDSRFAGQGYMTEAVEALQRLTFEKYEATKLIILCDTENLASNKVAQKLGYSLDGTLRKDKFSEYSQTYKDLNIYSLLTKGI